MTDLVQLQNDLLLLLQSVDALANVNIIGYRKLRLQSEIDLSAIWLTVRNGRSGCGVAIAMPTFRAVDPNVPGPQGKIVLNFAIIEEPNLNLTPAAGTLLDAETTAQTVLDVLHLQIIDGIGEIFADGTSMEPTEEFPPGVPLPRGMVAYLVTVYVREASNQTFRVDQPAVDATAIYPLCGFVNTSAFPNAAIYYTLDGTLPAPTAVNPGAIQYLGHQFSLAGIKTVRWAAYQAGYNPSSIGQSINPTP